MSFTPLLSLVGSLGSFHSWLQYQKQTNTTLPILKQPFTVGKTDNCQNTWMAEASHAVLNTTQLCNHEVQSINQTQFHNFSIRLTHIETYLNHRRFQGRELTRALMVTAEGSVERRIALIHIPHWSTENFSVFQSSWLSGWALVALSCFVFYCAHAHM